MPDNTTNNQSSFFYKKAKEDIKKYNILKEQKTNSNIYIGYLNQAVENAIEYTPAGKSDNRNKILALLEETFQEPDQDKKPKSDLELFTEYCSHYASITYGPRQHSRLAEIMEETLDKIRRGSLPLILNAKDNNNEASIPLESKLKLFNIAFKTRFKSIYNKLDAKLYIDLSEHYFDKLLVALPLINPWAAFLAPIYKLIRPQIKVGELSRDKLKAMFPTLDILDFNLAWVDALGTRYPIEFIDKLENVESIINIAELSATWILNNIVNEPTAQLKLHHGINWKIFSAHFYHVMKQIENQYNKSPADLSNENQHDEPYEVLQNISYS